MGEHTTALYGPRRALLRALGAAAAAGLAGCEALGDEAGTEDAGFGRTLSLADDTAVVGAPEAGESGHAYTLHHSDGEWSLATTIVSADPAPDDELGRAVARDGARALVGAPNYGADPPGRAFLYEL